MSAKMQAQARHSSAKEFGDIGNRLRYEDKAMEQMLGCTSG